MNTSRERLRQLVDLLDSAPFDVSWLRAQLEASHALPESEAELLLRHTLTRLDRAQFAVSFALPRTEREAAVRQRAIDWLATARAKLADHILN